MDLLLLAEDDAKVERILSQYSYGTVHKSENVAPYASDLAPHGNIDVIYAFRDISRSMLERSVAKEILADLTIRVLIPEDIIGLKVQALVNDPKREARDNADITALVNAQVTRDEQIDWELLQDYYELFERSDAFGRLREKYDKTQ